MTVCTCVKSVKQCIAVREHAGSANHPRINNDLNLDIAIEDVAEKHFYIYLVFVLLQQPLRNLLLKVIHWNSLSPVYSQFIGRLS